VDSDYQLQIRQAVESDCPADWSWTHPAGSKPGYLFWLVLRGRGLLQCQQQEFALFPGQCFVMPLTASYHGSHDISDPVLIPWVIFDWINAAGESAPTAPAELPGLQRTLADPSFAAQLVDRVIGSFQAGDKLAAQTWLQSLLLEVQRCDAQAAMMPPGLPLAQARKIEHLCRLIRSKPGMSYDIATLARMFGSSVDHFTRVFRRVAGSTPSEFIIQCRISESMTLLRFSPLSIGAIAAELGYASAFYFSRQFRDRTGISPTDFRNGGTAQFRQIRR